jgi:hypothetical protein
VRDSVAGCLKSYHNCLSGLPIVDNLNLGLSCGSCRKKSFTCPLTELAKSSIHLSTSFSVSSLFFSLKRLYMSSTMVSIFHPPKRGRSR